MIREGLQEALLAALYVKALGNGCKPREAARRARAGLTVAVEAFAEVDRSEKEKTDGSD